MNRVFALAILFLLLLSACSKVPTQTSRHDVPIGPGIFFVATNGDDSSSGLVARVTSTGGPFKTLDRAITAATQFRKEQGNSLRQPVRIYLRGGTYWLDQPIVVSPEESGSEGAPLIIAAYPGEKPILSAGRPIRNWRTVTIDDKTLWAADVPAARTNDWFFHQFWVKGERRTRARHPNTGYFQVQGLPDATSGWEVGNQRVQFKAGDLTNWPSASDGEIVVADRWVESRMPVASIDDKANIFSSTKRSVFQLQAGDPFYVEHVFEVLDTPGEWFLNRKEGILYYMPLPGEQIEGFVAIAPQLTQCLRLEGDPAQNRFVHNIEFRGITFANNEWYFPHHFESAEKHISSTPDPQIYGFAQAAYGVPGAIQGEGVKHCSFIDCTIRNIGSYAVELGRGCQSNSISRCEIADMAAGGVRIGETAIRTNLSEQTFGNEISDCRIYSGGNVFASGEGVWIGQSFNNRVAHNAIHDFFYTGISIGWTWGYGPSLATNNVIEYNEVYHIGRKANGDGPILSDMGGIYTLGIESGTRILNNFWHDVAGLRYGGWGIYFDEGTTGITAQSNVVMRTTHGGFHQHYGKENIVENNVFGFARDAQLQRSRAEGHLSFTFERNIVYFDSGKVLEGEWTGGSFKQDYNVYFDTRTNSGSMNFIGGWEQWRKNGHDVHSIIIDPLLSSTDGPLVQIGSESALSASHFQPIDLHTVGPRTRDKRDSQ